MERAKEHGAADREDGARRNVRHKAAGSADEERTDASIDDADESQEQAQRDDRAAAGVDDAVSDRVAPRDIENVACWVDAHVHLDAMDQAARAWALARAAEGEYRGSIPGVDALQWEKAFEDCGAYETIDFAVGMHPWELTRGGLAVSDWKDRLVRALDHPRVVAMGEIGLDWVHFKEDEDRARSDHLFIEQLEIARAHDVPVILHVVKAHARAVEILKEHGQGLRGMVHAFSGSLEELRNYNDLGWCVGIGTLATYTNAHRAIDVAREVPSGMWLLETDGPYLAQGRGRRGTGRSEDICTVTSAIAEIRGMTVEAARAEARATYARLFGA